MRHESADDDLSQMNKRQPKTSHSSFVLHVSKCLGLTEAAKRGSLNFDSERFALTISFSAPSPLSIAYRASAVWRAGCPLSVRQLRLSHTLFSFFTNPSSLHHPLCNTPCSPSLCRLYVLCNSACCILQVLRPLHYCSSLNTQISSRSPFAHRGSKSLLHCHRQSTPSRFTFVKHLIFLRLLSISQLSDARRCRLPFYYDALRKTLHSPLTKTPHFSRTSDTTSGHPTSTSHQISRLVCRLSVIT